LQTIESLENAIEALKEERNEWCEQAKAAATTIEKQAEALAMATAASARAITQADEMRRQMGAIEHIKPEPKPEAAPVPPPLLEPEATANKGKLWQKLFGHKK
jgi:hypothetical protein